MKIKKWLTTALAVAMAVSALTVAVSAADIQPRGDNVDKGYTFNFSGYETRTLERRKWDDTNTYMKCMYAGASYTAHAVAAISGFNGGDYIDVSRGYRYTFYQGSEIFMRTWAYEYGQEHGGATVYTKIAAVPSVNYGFTAGGVWSPDSV